MKQAQSEGKPYEIELTQNTAAIDAHLLLVPKYRDAANRVIDQRDPARFDVQTQELADLQQYIAYLDDDRLLLAHHNLMPRAIANLHRALAEPDRYLKSQDTARRFGNLNLLIRQLTDHLEIIPKEYKSFEPLGDEINHYKHIQVLLEDLKELERLRETIKRVQEYTAEVVALDALYGQISRQEYNRRFSLLREKENFVHDSKLIDIWNLANHYYLPVILDPADKADYIRHIIREPSEVHFVQDLDRHLQNQGNGFEQFDWWLFSKIDETRDDVYLPYYDPDTNAIRGYFPDFVFWLQKGSDYTILFVDPKGMRQSAYQRKVNGYERLFTDGDDNAKPLARDHLSVRVRLALYTEDANLADDKYRAYWFDSIAGLLKIFD